VHRLGVPRPLRRTLASTNVSESACSVVETVGRNGKRGRPGDPAERWVGSGWVVAEAKVRRVKGDPQIPLWRTALQNAAEKKAVAQTA
jgi:putative transposase